jgi:predicted O-methyltransferase YrrM
MPGSAFASTGERSEEETVAMKNLLPMSLRHSLRPSYQHMQRRWRESSWSAKPSEWKAIREHAHSETNFGALFAMASSEFGISQVPSEIEALIERLRILRPRTIVEIGTHKGGNSFLFCHALPTPTCMVGVDLCVQNAEKLIYFTRRGQCYHALHGDSQTTAMQLRVQSRLAGQPIDFLFIDGDHSHAGVKTDFDLYAPLVRSGGLIALHDILSDHRTRYGRDTGCYAGEVHRFWAELKAKFNCIELVADPEQDGFGIGVVLVR